MSPSLVSLLTFIPLLVLTSLSHLAIAIQETNVTVDDIDGSLSYRGTQWQTTPSELSFQGTHQHSNDLAASVTLNFIGTAVYMLSPKWPYEAQVAISLDGSPTVTVDLLDPSTTEIIPYGQETLKYAVVWSVTSLTNTSHTVVVSRAGIDLNVDGFLYTHTSPDEQITTSSSSNQVPSSSSVSQGPTTTSSATSPNSSSSETGVVQSTSSNSKTLPIALGTTLGVIALLAVVAAIIFLRRRRDKQRRLPPMSSGWDNSAFTPQFQSVNVGGGDRTSFPVFSSAMPITTAYTGYSSVPTHATSIQVDSYVNNGSSSTGRGQYDPYNTNTDATSTAQPHRSPSPPSEKTFLRGETNTGTNAPLPRFSSLAYEYSGSSDVTPSSQVIGHNNNALGWNRIMSSQEEKAALYQTNYATSARSVTPTPPPMYEQ